MRKLLLLSLLALVYQSASAQLVTESFGSGANAFTMDFVTIGNPNNSADTTGTPNPAGRVDYIYNIGKYEISREIIEKANAVGGLGITLQNMTSFGGNGVNRPATGLSWNEAAKFVNWINFSKGFQVAYNFTTTGANDNITLWSENESAQGSSGLLNRFRHKDAYFFLPSMDEWYKAAHGSINGTWYDYATGSDTQPTGVSAGTAVGTAVIRQGIFDGPADISNAGGLSAYGTMGQGGNVSEWNESAFDGNNDSPTERRMLRNSWWTSGGVIGIENLPPDDEGLTYSLRVASVPEPSSLSLLALGGLVMALRRRR